MTSNADRMSRPDDLDVSSPAREPAANVAGAWQVLLAMTESDERMRAVSSLVSLGCLVSLAGTVMELLDVVRRRSPDLVLVQSGFGREGGADWVAMLRQEAPELPLLMLPANPNWPEPGATGDPPPAIRELIREAERLLGARVAHRATVRRKAHERPSFDPFLGKSVAIRRLAEEAHKALVSESPVLIEGETGSGKGVLAAWIHREGPRAQSAFIDLNCAGFSRELMDSELFGHERGAFTGAITAKPGLLEVADQGTLFLDEIGDMDVPIQAKLLKIIEEKRFRRIGDTRERRADVRIIAATHHDLPQLVREGRFREDLFYRIGVLSLRIPPLRRRRADIGALAARIVESLARDLDRPLPEISRATVRELELRPWHGNLRELRNTLERALLAVESGPIEPRHLEPERPATTAGGTLEAMERAYIQHVLDEEQHVERAAERLGIPRSTFYQKLRALGLSPRR